MYNITKKNEPECDRHNVCGTCPIHLAWQTQINTLKMNKLKQTIKKNY